MSLSADGFWLPSVLSRLGKGKGEAGTVGSAIEMSYGLCSLVNGIIIDATRCARPRLGPPRDGRDQRARLGDRRAASDRAPVGAQWRGAVGRLAERHERLPRLVPRPGGPRRLVLAPTRQNAGAALVPLTVARAINRSAGARRCTCRRRLPSSPGSPSPSCCMAPARARKARDLAAPPLRRSTR